MIQQHKYTRVGQSETVSEGFAVLARAKYWCSGPVAPPSLNVSGRLSFGWFLPAAPVRLSGQHSGQRADGLPGMATRQYCVCVWLLVGGVRGLWRLVQMPLIKCFTSSLWCPSDEQLPHPGSWVSIVRVVCSRQNLGTNFFFFKARQVCACALVTPTVRSKFTVHLAADGWMICVLTDNL